MKENRNMTTKFRKTRQPLARTEEPPRNNNLFRTKLERSYSEVNLGTGGNFQNAATWPRDKV